MKISEINYSKNNIKFLFLTCVFYIILSSQVLAQDNGNNQPEFNIIPPPPPLSSVEKQPDFSVLEVVDRIRFCVHGADSKERLKCYDSLAATLGIPIDPDRPDVSASANAMYSWAIVKNKLTDEVSATLMATDVNSDHTAFSNSQAAFVIRCQQKQIQILFTSNKMVGTRTSSIKISTGSSIPYNSVWESSSSGNSIGLWTSDKSVPLIQDLTKSNKMSVRANYRDGEMFAVFDIPGITQAYDSVLKSCKK